MEPISRLGFASTPKSPTLIDWDDPPQQQYWCRILGFPPGHWPLVLAKIAATVGKVSEQVHCEDHNWGLVAFDYEEVQAQCVALNDTVWFDKTWIFVSPIDEAQAERIKKESEGENARRLRQINVGATKTPTPIFISPALLTDGFLAQPENRASVGIPESYIDLRITAPTFLEKVLIFPAVSRW